MRSHPVAEIQTWRIPVGRMEMKTLLLEELCVLVEGSRRNWDDVNLQPESANNIKKVIIIITGNKLHLVSCFLNSRQQTLNVHQLLGHDVLRVFVSILRSILHLLCTK